MFPPDTLTLVVDDMPTIRDMVRQNLKQLGIANILEAEDGEQAMTMIERNRTDGTDIGLVICDWNMPNMKGIELLKLCRSKDEYKELPFVLLTSESDREQVTEAVFAGVSQYIVKPFSLNTLTEKLKAAWTKHNK